MRFQSIYIIVLAAGALSAPAYSNESNISPCGIITSRFMEFYSNSSNLGQNFFFDPELGYECLLSSTIDNDLAASFTNELNKYLQFQTTLSYLKSPPADYYYPAVDILGGMNGIGTKAAAGGYQSQYEFDQAIVQLLNSAHDGHLSVRPCSSSSINFVRGVDIVSVSVDGVQAPLIYTVDDAIAGLANSTVSNIASINGQNATALIENYGLSQLADPDASYNIMFWSLARSPTVGLPISNFFFTGFFYPGPSTNLTFANGTTKSYPNSALIRPGDWSTNITDGQSFTETLCIVPAQVNSTTSTTSSSTATPTSATSPAPLPTLLGHPETPVVLDPYQQVAGYFLNGSDHQDTAVLCIAGFENTITSTNGSAEALSFQNTAREFFAAVESANKTKLIIDLSGNGGGNILLPFDVFKHLFPKIDPYSASRLRVSTAANIYGLSLAEFNSELLTMNSTVTSKFAPIEEELLVAPWNYVSSLTADLQNFTSWNELYPPVVANGDNFTALVRAPVNSTTYDIFTDNIVPFGFAGQPLNPQPFAVEDIVILTDGFCASACSIFAEFLTRQAGVKTVTVGGRPSVAPMQAIGGTKGSQVLSFDLFQEASQVLFELNLIPSSLIPAAEATFPGLINLPLGDPSALASYSLNLRDNIPQGDTEQIPLQFIFEPADCRIFYTAETVSSPSALWEYVAGVAWGGNKCASGSITAAVAKNGSSPGGGSGNNGTTSGATRQGLALSTLLATIGAVACFVQIL